MRCVSFACLVTSTRSHPPSLSPSLFLTVCLSNTCEITPPSSYLSPKFLLVFVKAASIIFPAREEGREEGP